MSDLRVVRFELKNFRCFAHLVLEPGTITTLTGDNGIGKSSILDAYRALFDGGWVAERVMNGTDEAEVIAELSDGTLIRLALKLPNAKRKKYQRILEITAPSGELIKAPQEYLNTLADGISYDPAHFLTASKAERAKYITSFLRVSLSAEELANAVPAEMLTGIDMRQPPFDVIARLRQIAYDRRATANKAFKELEGYIQTLRKEIPSLNAESADLDQAERTAADAKHRIAQGFAVVKAEAAEQAQAARHAAAQAAQEAKRTAHEEYQRKLAEIDKDLSEKLRAVDALLADENERLMEEWQPQIQATTLAHEAARQAKQEYDNAVGARQALEKQEGKAKELMTESLLMDRTIEALDELKRRKMESSPIPGLELRDGEVYVDGRTFDNGTNTARKIEIAMALAAQNPGRLPLLLLDDAEHLGPEMWDAMQQACIDSGFQIVAARVTNGPLAIQTIG